MYGPNTRIEITGYVSVYLNEDGTTWQGMCFKTLEEANKNPAPGRIAVIQVHGSGVCFSEVENGKWGK